MSSRLVSPCSHCQPCPSLPLASQSLVGSQELIPFVISLLPIRTPRTPWFKAAWSGGRRRARQRHWVFCELMTIFQVTFNGFPFQVLVQSPSELVKTTSVLCILLQGVPQPCNSAAALHGVTCPNPKACSSTENGQLSVWNQDWFSWCFLSLSLATPDFTWHFIQSRETCLQFVTTCPYYFKQFCIMCDLCLSLLMPFSMLFMSILNRTDLSADP